MPDATAPDKNSKKLRARLRTLLRAVFGATFVFILLLSVIIWISKPQGILWLQRADNLGADTNIDGIIAETESHIEAAFGLHRSISGMVANNSIEPIERPNISDKPEPRIRSIIKSLRLTATFDDSGNKIEAVFDLLPLIEALYQFFPVQDTYVTITSFEPANCATESGAQCYRMTGRYGSPGIISRTFEGDKETLSNDFAALVMMGHVRESGDAWLGEKSNQNSEAVPPHLLEPDLPENMAGLIDSAKGLSILKNGCPSTGNDNISRNMCLLEARQLLLAADPDLDLVFRPRSSAAALGLALIALDAAMSDARSGSPTLVIERKLLLMEQYLRNVRNSKFISGALAMNGLPAFTYLLASADIDPALLTKPVTQEFTCASAKYRRAEWSDSLKLVRNREILPKPLRPYFEALWYDAQLYNSLDDPAKLIEIFQDLKSDIDDPPFGPDSATWPLRAIEFYHICAPQMDEPALRSERSGQLVENLPDGNLVQYRVALAAIEFCENQDLLPDTKENLFAAAKSYDTEFLLGSVKLDLARWYARTGDIPNAVILLQGAIMLPWTMQVIKNHPDFAAVRADQAQFSALYLEQVRQGTIEGLEACIQNDL